MQKLITMSTPTSHSLSGKKSPRQHAVAEEENTKKKMKKSVSSRNRIWTEEDELALLKGFAAYRATGHLPNGNGDWDTFRRLVGDPIAAKFSSEQLRLKIRNLKGRFLTRMEKINQGNDPIFSDDGEAFRYSNMIWGQNDSQVANDEINNVEEETLKGDEEVAANVEPLNEKNVAVETDFGNGNGTDADESCAVRDAFETLMSPGLSDYQKKLQLEKLMNLGAGERKELSDEWNALMAHQVNLEIKKLRLFAKLAEEVIDK